MTTISTTTSPSRRVVVLAPNGPLGPDDAAPLRQALRDATPEAGLVVVDLLDAPSVDDAVVEVLVGGSVRCAQAGVRFVVANADSDAWVALTTARVAGVLRAHRRGTPPLSDLVQLLEL